MYTIYTQDVPRKNGQAFNLAGTAFSVLHHTLAPLLHHGIVVEQVRFHAPSEDE